MSLPTQEKKSTKTQQKINTIKTGVYSNRYCTKRKKKTGLNSLVKYYRIDN
jgi:hypothetical protein